MNSDFQDCVNNYIKAQTEREMKDDRDHPRILVVEDDRSMYPIYESLLKRSNKRVEIVWATTATEAMQVLETKNFDALISDVVLPNLETGIDLWREVRGRFPKLKTVLTSAIGTQAFLTLFEGEPTCPRFLPKPFNTKQTLSCFMDLIAAQ